MKNRQVKQLIETNTQVMNFMDYLKEKYPFDDQETEMINNINAHMSNLNLIFGKIKK